MLTAKPHLQHSVRHLQILPFVLFDLRLRVDLHLLELVQLFAQDLRRHRKKQQVTFQVGWDLEEM